MDAFKVTRSELVDVANEIRSINGENEIYKWPEQYQTKISEINEGITTLKDDIKQIIADRDLEQKDEILEKNLNFPAETINALSGDGIDLDGDGESDTDSILDIILGLEAASKDIKAIEITEQISGSDNIFDYLNRIEQQYPFVEKERFSVYVIKNIFKRNNAIVCIPTAYDENLKKRIVKWGFFLYSEDTTGYEFFSKGNPPGDVTVIPAGTTLIRVAIYDETV